MSFQIRKTGIRRIIFKGKFNHNLTITEIQESRTKRLKLNNILPRRLSRRPLRLPSRRPISRVVDKPIGLVKRTKTFNVGVIVFDTLDPVQVSSMIMEGNAKKIRLVVENSEGVIGHVRFITRDGMIIGDVIMTSPKLKVYELIPRNLNTSVKSIPIDIEVWMDDEGSVSLESVEIDY